MPGDEKYAMKTIQQYLPDTINLHFHAACEMQCKHCFATFNDCSKKLSLTELTQLINMISVAPLSPGMTKARRLNLVGGEPTLHPLFDELVFATRDFGLRVSMVSNGYSLLKKGISEAIRAVELVGVSIDSLTDITNVSIGRAVKGRTISESEWLELFALLREAKVELKINTTLTKHNVHEDFAAFILRAQPLRWKVFQAMIVHGQNEKEAGSWYLTRPEYDAFIKRHQSKGVVVYPEPEDLMRGSYAMISPDGRFFDSTLGHHRYSDLILKIGIQKAWEQVSCDPSLYNQRTKNY